MPVGARGTELGVCSVCQLVRSGVERREGGSARGPECRPLPRDRKRGQAGVWVNWPLRPPMPPREASSAVMEGAGWRRALGGRGVVDAISTGLGFVPISSRPSALFHFPSASRAAPPHPSDGEPHLQVPKLLSGLISCRVYRGSISVHGVGGLSPSLVLQSVPTSPGRPHRVLPVRVAL